MKTKALFTGFLCLVLSTTLKAQEIIAVAGDFHSSNQGSLSWTIGDLITETTSNQQAVLSPGFQQFTLVVTGLPPFNQLEADWSVYPNPATNTIHIKAANLDEYQDVKALLFDLQGKLIFEQNLGNGQNTVNLSAIVSGTYMLKLIDSQHNYLNSFYIVKQQ